MRLALFFLCVGSLTLFAEQYMARNADWPQRLAELTAAKEQAIKAQGFSVELRGQRIDKSEKARSESGTLDEEQADCALRQIKELAAFLRISKYQHYLKQKKVQKIELAIIDNTAGHVPDTQLKYGPELLHEDSYGVPLPAGTAGLIVRAVLTSKRACITSTFENLSLSFDWWDQDGNGLED